MNKALFIGHSLFGPVMPAMFNSFMVDQGSVILAEYQIINGAPLRYNWDNGAAAEGVNARAVLPSGEYGTVVVTEAIPLDPQIQWNDSQGYAKRYSDLALSANANSQFYLYETWHEIGTDTQVWRDQITSDLPKWQGIIDYVNDNAAATAPEALVIPAGQAMGNLHDAIEAGEVPGMSSIQELFSDNIHLNDTGAWFVAALYAATIAGVDVEALPLETSSVSGTPFGGPDAALAQVMAGVIEQTLDDFFGDDAAQPAGDGSDNILIGDVGDDVINGRGGDDEIYGDAGDDLLAGGNGDDTVEGGSDNDLLRGNSGNDSITGGEGLDSVFGGTGHDEITVGNGDDSVLGQGGDDTIFGGTGEDILRGGSGNDSIMGGDDDDDLFGNGNNDTLMGGMGDDSIQGNAGSDRLFGGGGDDTLFSGIGGDRLDGGAGNDLMNGGTNDGVRDVFVFMVGYDMDRINQFDQAGTDLLELDADLWTATDPELSRQEVIDTFGTLNTDGTILTLDFGGTDVLEVQNSDGIVQSTLGLDVLFI